MYSTHEFLIDVSVHIVIVSRSSRGRYWQTQPLDDGGLRLHVASGNVQSDHKSRHKRLRCLHGHELGSGPTLHLSLTVVMRLNGLQSFPIHKPSCGSNNVVKVSHSV